MCKVGRKERGVLCLYEASHYCLTYDCYLSIYALRVSLAIKFFKSQEWCNDEGFISLLNIVYLIIRDREVLIMENLKQYRMPTARAITAWAYFRSSTKKPIQDHF